MPYSRFSLIETLSLEGLRKFWAHRYGETRRIVSRNAHQGRGLNVGLGARLRRRWKGSEVEVDVEAKRFHWEGQLSTALCQTPSRGDHDCLRPKPLRSMSQAGYRKTPSVPPQALVSEIPDINGMAKAQGNSATEQRGQ
jgi:hypothetical protein